MKTKQHTSNDSNEPTLGAVIIARDEETLIAQCLRSVLEALEVFPNAPVVLVDSDSSDQTVNIALGFPVHIYRYQANPLTAGAGRRIGFEKIQAQYVLFVDGDCRIEKSWPALAIARMEKSPKTAVIYGPRREFAKEGIDQPQITHLDITTYEENGLGGNAIYRAEVLRAVGGFNPFLVGQEEGELLGRILAKGYHATETTQIMYYHYTILRDTPKDLLRRLRRGHFIGSGQALRLALQQGKFSFQARQLNRYLIMQFFLAVGFAAIVSSVILSNLTPFLSWLMAGAVFFGLLAVRRRSLMSASRIASEWFIGAIMVPIGFIRSVEDIKNFSPKVDKIKSD